MSSAPHITDLEMATGAVAANADDVVTVGAAPYAGTVTAVTYSPEATITGQDTESRTIRLVNKGLDGNGTTVVATLALTAGVSAPDFDEKTIPLSGTPANLVVADGDVLVWESTHVGTTGLADPGGLVRVTISRS